MPVVIYYILGTAALVTAAGVIWKKAIVPAAAFITNMKTLAPLVAALVEIFKANPKTFSVLNEIAAQFKTDSGSSLRDVVNRLEVAAIENKTSVVAIAEAARKLEVVAAAKDLLNVRDREVMQELTLKLDRVRIEVDRGAATALRNEERAKGVASDLAHKQEADDAARR